MSSGGWTNSRKLVPDSTNTAFWSQSRARVAGVARRVAEDEHVASCGRPRRRAAARRPGSSTRPGAARPRRRAPPPAGRPRCRGCAARCGRPGPPRRPAPRACSSYASTSSRFVACAAPARSSSSCSSPTPPPISSTVAPSTPRETTSVDDPLLGAAQPSLAVPPRQLAREAVPEHPVAPAGVAASGHLPSMDPGGPRWERCGARPGAAPCARRAWDSGSHVVRASPSSTALRRSAVAAPAEPAEGVGFEPTMTLPP